MILEFDEENKKLHDEPDKYKEKKKQLEYMLDNISKNKTKSETIYDPTSIILKHNKLEEHNKFEENEKKSFKFLNEYCEINKDIDEISGLNFDSLEEKLNEQKKSDQKDNPGKENTAGKFEQDIRMRNIMEEYDEMCEDSANKKDMNNEDVSMGDYDDSKFKKVRKIDNVKKRKNLEEME